jgi:ElaB/YqjD/DUF883 family membrane-anchored ribosome-binding protein
MTTANTAALKTNSQSDDLSHQIEALRADMSKLMATVSGDLSEGLDQAGRQISRTSRDARKAATDTVIEHPLAAMGIAVGLGVLLGLIARKG